MNNEDETPSAAGPQGPYQPVVPDVPNNEPVSEGASDEPDDSLLQSAAKNMSDDEVGVPPPSDFTPKKGKAKKVLLLLFLLALIGGGAAAYYFLVYKKPAPAAQPVQQVETPAANTFTPENVAYAFREKEADPFVMYLRPVAGGDRVEAGQLGKDAYPEADVYGQNVVVVFDNKLQISTDGGKTYSQILEPEAGKEITSAAFNTDGTKLGVAILDTDKNQNTVSSMDLDGQNMTEVFTSKDHSGIRLMGWDTKSVIFDAYKVAGDGHTPNPYQYSVETKKSTQLVTLEDGLQTWSAAVSDDLTKLVYSTGKVDPNPDGIGGSPLAPHTVSVVDVASGESKDIATVGKAGEKATNGTPLQRDTIVGFEVNATTPYYTDGGKLYAVSGEEPTLLYETKNTIVDVRFVDNDTIISASGTPSDFVLANFNVQSKEATTIFEGDSNTAIFGVTTK